jgi:hypothetical protein
MIYVNYLNAPPVARALSGRPGAAEKDGTMTD